MADEADGALGVGEGIAFDVFRGGLEAVFEADDGDVLGEELVDHAVGTDEACEVGVAAAGAVDDGGVGVLGVGFWEIDEDAGDADVPESTGAVVAFGSRIDGGVGDVLVPEGEDEWGRLGGGFGGISGSGGAEESGGDGEADHGSEHLVSSFRV